MYQHHKHYYTLELISIYLFKGKMAAASILEAVFLRQGVTIVTSRSKKQITETGPAILAEPMDTSEL